MERMKRGVHLDFHTMPGIYDFGETFDPKGFAQTLVEAKVKYLNAVAQCNLGFCYFYTNVGIRYPGLKSDLFGDIVRECTKAGIKVVAYVSAGLNHEQSRLHPEWCNMNENGQIIYGDRTVNFFRNVCYNTGYADHILALLKELLDNYELDGLFLDSTVPRACYCPRCTEKMLEAGVDITNREVVEAFGMESVLKFRERVLALLPAGKRLKMNGLGQRYSTHGEIECLPTGVWGYEFYAPTCAETRNIHKDVIYMTGRFQRSWGDFGGMRTTASLENDLFDALLSNAQISVGDHMHPRGGLEPSVYAQVKNLFTKMERYESWTDAAKYLPEVGIVYHPNYPDSSFYGLGRMMGELKYNFDILSPEMDISRFQAVILPDSMTVSPQLAEKLSAYLAGGGKLITTGISGLNLEKTGWALEELNFMRFHGLDAKSTAYYQSVDDGKGLPVRSMYEAGILMSAENAEDVTAVYVEPYFDRHWDGKHGYFYTPPAKATEYAACACHGNIQMISFPVFTAYNHYAAGFHKQLIQEALEKAIPFPLVDAKALPSTARVSLTGTESYHLLHVKVTYPEARGGACAIEEHNVLPGGRTIRVKGSYKRVVLLPQEQGIPFRTEAGYTVFELPAIVGYQMFGLIKTE